MPVGSKNRFVRIARTLRDRPGVCYQTKKQSCALLQGSMSGFVDTSKLDKNLMNWMYDGEKTKK